MSALSLWRWDGEQWVCLSRRSATVEKNAAAGSSAVAVTVITITAANGTVGTAQTVSAKVTANGTAVGGAGTLTIKNGTTTIVSAAPDASGTVSKSWSPPTSGSVKLEATYTGVANTYANSYASKTITISKITPTISMSASSTSVNNGTVVTFTVTTSATSGTIRFQYSTDGGATWKDWTNNDITLPTKTKGWTSNSPSANWRWRCKHLGSTTYNTVTSAAITVDVKELKTVATTYVPSWSRSWTASGSSRGTTPLYRGYYDSTNGDQRSAVGFSPSVPAGASVSKVEVYLYNEHWYNNSGGGTLSIGTHGSASAPSAYPGGAEIVSATWSSERAGKWITLPSTTHAGVASGTVKGITLRPAGSTDKSHYGYFSGDGTTNQPQLRVTYTYWA